MPPLWQYFLPLRKEKRQTSPLLPPKGTDPRTPAAFPLQQGRFLGGHDRAMIPIADPLAGTLRG
jgi:hypothetical protein